MMWAKAVGKRDLRPELRDAAQRRVAWLRGAGSIVLFLLVWEVGLRVLNVPEFLIPRPLSVARAMRISIQRNPLGMGSLARSGWSTYSAAFTAFALSSLLGFTVALILAQWRWLENTIKPYIVAFQTLPRIAIAPLFLIWFGSGISSKILLATLVAFFPIMVNTLAGFKSTPPEWLEWMRMHGSSAWQTFMHVRLWWALPYIFAGLEVALVFSILGVVVTEFVGAREGLGVLILQSHYSVDVAGVFAVFVILVAVGLTFRGLLMALRRRLLFWAELGERGEL